MKVKMSKKDLKKIILICGSCISFYIGAGFATMQEIVQYEVSYGSLFPIVILVTAVIYVYTNLSFATNGNRLHLKRGGDIYEVYGSVLGRKFGKLMGRFFDYFSALFCYMSFIVMCGGANATVSQQWGLPQGVGAIALTVLVIVTVVFGLDGILKALSKIGPIIIILILVVSTFATVSGASMFTDGLAQIDAGEYSETMKQVGNGNPIASGASYGGFVILWFAAFISEIGAQSKLSSVNKGMLASALFIFGAAALCCTGVIGYIAETAGADIPALILAAHISPAFAQMFAAVICAGIYTSAVPLLWTGVRKVTNEETKSYKLIVIIAGVVGCLTACYVPYKGLINFLYGLNGYLGFILVFLMVIYDLRTGMSSKALHH